MKYTGNNFKYVFSPSSKTIDFTMEPGFLWTNLFSIVNLTAKTTIYAVGIAGLGASADATGKTLTLDYDTSAMASGDALMIIADEGNDSLADLLAAAKGRTDPSAASATPTGIVTRSVPLEDLMRQVIVELRLNNLLLAQVGNIERDVEVLRNDIASSVVL